ncbi:MAG: hypothetical protein U9N53_07975 [Bacteroidota bacterium]|nr:hypothetical protein [Bacteroidota bacterium]
MDKKETKSPVEKYADNKPNRTEKQSTNFIPKELLIATNIENLKSILTAGLICPKEGYKKYYKDPGFFSPGHVPIFIDKVPPYIFSECQDEEDKDIYNTIIALDLSWDNLIPSVRGFVNNKGEQVKGQLDNNAPVSIIFFEGVIPVSAIKTIYFRAKEEKAEFLGIDYGNFNPHIFSLRVNFKLFDDSRSSDAQIFPDDSIHFTISDDEKQIPDHKDYLESDARGGVISLLMHSLPPLPESENLIKNVVNESSLVNADLQVLPGQLEIINNWIWEKRPLLTDDVDKILLWHLLNLLSPLDPHKGITASQFLAILQDKFETSEDLRKYPKPSYQELKDRFKKRFDQIIDAMNQIIDPDDVFQDSSIKSRVLRGLLLFLMYQKGIYSFQKNKDLIKSWQITPADTLFAHILYAAWRGWKQIDQDLRPKDKVEIYSLCTFMSNWHNKHYPEQRYVFGPDASFKISGNCSPWEKDMLLKADWNRHRKLRECAIDLAKKRDWQSIQLKIKAESNKLSELKFSKNGDVALTLLGSLSVKETIDKEGFMDSLKQSELTDEEKKDFQKIFGS